MYDRPFHQSLNNRISDRSNIFTSFFSYMEGDKIKAKIQELCPEIKQRCNGGSPCLCEIILLSDVLRAIKKSKPETYPAEWQRLLHSFTDWNLKKDSYDDQTEETKGFIGSLLGV